MQQIEFLNKKIEDLVIKSENNQRMFDEKISK